MTKNEVGFIVTEEKVFREEFQHSLPMIEEIEKELAV